MDISYLLFLQELRQANGGALDGLMSFFTKFGSASYSTAIIILWYWCVHKEQGSRILMACGLGDALNGLFKLIFCVYRPWIRDSRIQPAASALPEATGYSFPSGHSTRAAAAYGALSWELRKRKGWVALLLLLALLVGFSRNYLGVHTPQDVLVGLTLGVFAVALSHALFRLLEKHPRWDVFFVLGAWLFGGGILLFASVKSYPMELTALGELVVDPESMKPDTFLQVGVMMGVFLGWFWERRRIGFSTRDLSWKRRVLRGVFGIVMVLALLKGGRPLLCGWLDPLSGNFLTGLIIGILVLGGYPWLFQRLEERKRA